MKWIRVSSLGALQFEEGGGEDGCKDENAILPVEFMRRVSLLFVGVKL